ncbi:MAG: hypothetical protein Q9169_004370 [Polycauliona sp. 2 TL-2023]
MDCLDIEEGQQPAQDEITLPLAVRPFPFLKLPREIRDIIYFHSFTRANAGPNAKPARICYMHNKASSRHFSTPYWGTERATRLLRVNHQVYNEASDMFYSTFHFHYPSTVKDSMVDDTLSILNIRSRALIRYIGFSLHIRSIQTTATAKDDAKNERAFDAAMRLLPNITQVEVIIPFIGHDVPKWEIGGVVKRILNILAPFKEGPVLIIRGNITENDQRSLILEKVRENLGRR